MYDRRLTAFFTQLEAELSTVHKTDRKVQFAVERLRARARKKAVFDANSMELSEKAVSDFVLTNASLANHPVSLPDDVVSNAREFILVALENYTSQVFDYCVQEPLALVHLHDLWGFGPGASNGILGSHPAVKMYQKWTCTRSSLSHVQNLRRNHPYLYLNDMDGQHHCSVVLGSKLSTVPKNEEKHRTIAIEPLGNMALQLAAGRYFEGVLRYLGWDIRKQQSRNKAAALLGSLTGLLATLDLRNASDMILIRLVQLLLPAKWFKFLMEIRSPYTTLPSGQTIELNMISTMGNGFTFPLMTLILLSLIYGWAASSNLTRRLYLDKKEVQVFGDDIIVPTAWYEGVCSTIEAAGLVVNRDKSYSTGGFRESCGGDYFEGFDVTPFYVKSLRQNSDVFVAINQVLAWSAKTNVWLTESLALLISMLTCPPYLVPEWKDPSSGILTSQVTRRYKSLEPVQVYSKYENSLFATPLAIGGYLVQRGANLFYLPRLYKTRHRVRQSRLPKGYLDGHDPLTRSLPQSQVVSQILLILGVVADL